MRKDLVQTLMSHMGLGMVVLSSKETEAKGS